LANVFGVTELSGMKLRDVLTLPSAVKSANWDLKKATKDL
jgi:hypothetical protein